MSSSSTVADAGCIRAPDTPVIGPNRLALIAAFAAIYLIWGSTFLAIRVAVETIPPWTMMGVRSVIAGLSLLLVARLTNGPRKASDAPVNWKAAILAGGLMFVGGHGILAWGEQRIPSGLAAVLLAPLPIWIPLAAWMLGAGERPGRPVYIGLALGLSGVVLLAAPSAFGAGAATGVDVLGAAALLFSALCWSFGTAVARKAPAAPSPLQGGGMQLVAGGILATLAGGLGGEWSTLAAHPVSTASLLATAYLIVFGSLVAFGAYSWLVQVSTPDKIGTYAFVNPVIALVIGWAFAGEQLGWRELGATLLVLAGVLAVLTGAKKSATAKPVVTKS